MKIINKLIEAVGACLLRIFLPPVALLIAAGVLIAPAFCLVCLISGILAEFGATGNPEADKMYLGLGPWWAALIYFGIFVTVYTAIDYFCGDKET